MDDIRPTRTPGQARNDARLSRRTAMIFYIGTAVTEVTVVGHGWWQILPWPLLALGLRATRNAIACREWADGYDAAGWTRGCGIGIVLHGHGPDDPCVLRGQGPDDPHPLDDDDQR